jgi:hypothetical protein
MSYTIDDKVILTFSAERLENEIFQAADGLIATVVERYRQSHLPGIDFYEVELDKPVADQNGRRIVTLSGLMEADLQPANVAEKINPKYLTKNAKAMKDEIKKHSHKDADDSSAYTSHPNGGWKADYDKSDKPYKTKVSQHTKKFKEMFGESINESEVDKALSNKSEKTGISKGILKKVYNRGLAAWRTGHRPGVSQHQWAMARVNSFATKGKGTWGKADKDLAKMVRAVNEDYDRATDTYSYRFDGTRSVDFNYSRDRIKWPAEVVSAIKRRFPEWNEEEEAELIGYGLTNKRFVLEDIEVMSTTVYYTIETDFGRDGLDDVYSSLKRVSILINFQIWDNEADDMAEEVEYEITHEPDSRKVKVKVGSFPIVPYYLEINVPDDLNPDEFRYEFQMGE